MGWSKRSKIDAPKFAQLKYILDLYVYGYHARGIWCATEGYIPKCIYYNYIVTIIKILDIGWDMVMCIEAQDRIH